MSTTLTANSPLITGLHELFASATHDASAAMCRWTDGIITVALDKVREVSLEEAAAALALGDEPLTMVVMTVEGELGGSIVLIFDDVNGRQLAAALLGRPADTDSPWSELEQSALMETGNILGCAYVGACAPGRPGPASFTALVHPGFWGQRGPAGPHDPGRYGQQPHALRHRLSPQRRKAGLADHLRADTRIAGRARAIAACRLDILT